MSDKQESSESSHTRITSGAIGGSVEVVLMQPMVGIKNALQEGRPVPMNPLHLYRGLAVSHSEVGALLTGTRLEVWFCHSSSMLSCFSGPLDPPMLCHLCSDELRQYGSNHGFAVWYKPYLLTAHPLQGRKRPRAT